MFPFLVNLKFLILFGPPCANELASGVDLESLPQPSVVQPCMMKKGKKTSTRGQDIPSSSALASKKQKTLVEEELLVLPSEAELEACARIAKAGKILLRKLEEKDWNSTVSWFQANLRKLEKKNLFIEGDLLDQEDKLRCAVEVESLKSADDDILALEAQVVAFQGEAEQYDAME